MARDFQTQILESGAVPVSASAGARGASAARSWALLGALSLVYFLINASTFNALGVVLPDMVRDLKWDWTEAGFGFTILGATVGGSSLIPAWMIRRFGVRATLLAGTGVMSAGFLSLAATHSIFLYFLGAGLCGVGYGMMALVPGTHVLAALFQHRGRPFGVYFTFGALGGVAGPWMVWLVNQLIGDGWRTFWLAQMIAAMALGLVCAAMVGGPEWLSKIAQATDDAVAREITSPAPTRIHRTTRDWTVAQALRTPQFLILLAAYFGHLLVGVTVASLSVAHLTQRGVGMTVALAMLSLESGVQAVGRAGASALGDRIDPKTLLLVAIGALAVGSAALSIADTYPMMLLYAVGSGLGFGLTGLAVAMLLLNYFGRRHNLEIFARTCLIGAFSALGPTLGGKLRDATGAFGSTFQIFAVVSAAIFLAVFFMSPPRAREA